MSDKTIEDYPEVDSWIQKNTEDGEFTTHPDFVEDAMMELLNEIEQLKVTRLKLDNLLCDCHSAAVDARDWELVDRINDAYIEEYEVTYDDKT
jgi:hypothetical protein